MGRSGIIGVFAVGRVVVVLQRVGDDVTPRVGGELQHEFGGLHRPVTAGDTHGPSLRGKRIGARRLGNLKIQIHPKVYALLSPYPVRLVDRVGHDWNFLTLHFQVIAPFRSSSNYLHLSQLPSSSPRHLPDVKKVKRVHFNWECSVVNEEMRRNVENQKKSTTATRIFFRLP